MTAGKTLVCVGQAALDRIYAIEQMPAAPTKVRALGMVEVGGGIAANAAVTAARLGSAVALWSRLGDDLAGQAIAHGLAAEGVDTAQLRRQPGGRSSTSAIWVDARGERWVVNDRGELADDAGWLLLAQLRGGEVGCVLADVRWPDGALAAFAAARAAGVPTVLDVDVGAERLDVLLPLTDYAIFSEPALAEFAARLVCGAAGDAIGASDATGATDATDATDATALETVQPALRHARALGARLAGVTLGARGFFWLEANRDAEAGRNVDVNVNVSASGNADVDADGNADASASANGNGNANSNANANSNSNSNSNSAANRDAARGATPDIALRHQPAFAIEVVDTTGAGDAFHGAFAWAVVQGHGAAAAARIASAVAALSCTRPGGRAGLPSREQLDDFLATAPTVA